uniref:Uncharacterized protein n=1 Tax=Anguilla anguilla TaxID=7936 RepID=A0A0E9TCB9_ANGAN
MAVVQARLSIKPKMQSVR